MEWHDKFESEDEFYYFHQPSTREEEPLDTGVKYFIHTDSEEQFANLKNNKPLLEQKTITDWSPLYNYYKDNPIVYKFNSDGFRDSEFSTKPDTVDVYLGCSFTSGVGLHEDDVWVTKVSEKLNFPKLNAGISGSGIIQQYRVLMWLLKRFNIRYLFHYYPITHARWQWYSPSVKGYKFWSPSSPSNTMIPELAEFRNISLMSHTFIKAIKQVCFEHGIKYMLEHKWVSLNRQKYGVEQLYARDAGHPGPLFHSLLAENFLKKLAN